MKKVKELKGYIFLLLISIVIFIIIIINTNNSDIIEISKIIGIDVSREELKEYVDTHGGFLGDGELFARVEFKNTSIDKIIKLLEKNKYWKKLPLTENLRTAVYGKIEENSTIEPMINNNEKFSNIPEIKNGYYCFVDRSSESTDPLDDSRVFDRSSYNFTIAIYDSDKNILYYYEIDT